MIDECGSVYGWKPEELDSFSILPSSGDCFRSDKGGRFYCFIHTKLVKLFLINLIIDK